jgi:hypothetical protein
MFSDYHQRDHPSDDSRIYGIISMERNRSLAELPRIVEVNPT